MNWFKKIIQKIKTASVTFSIVDSGKIAQPKNISDLCWMLRDWSHKNVPQEMIWDHPDQIAPDGFEDYDQPTGAINWYLPERVDPQRVVPYIQKSFQEELEPLGVEAKVVDVNESNMFKVPTIRIQVIQNKTTELEQMPEMNAANTNARALLRLLGIPPNYEGSISAQDLLYRISLSRQKTELFTREPVQEENMIDQGLPAERLGGYLDALQQIAERAQEMNNATIVWG